MEELLTYLPEGIWLTVGAIHELIGDASGSDMTNRRLEFLADRGLIERQLKEGIARYRV